MPDYSSNLTALNFRLSELEGKVKENQASAVTRHSGVCNAIRDQQKTDILRTLFFLYPTARFKAAPLALAELFNRGSAGKETLEDLIDPADLSSGSDYLLTYFSIFDPPCLFEDRYKWSPEFPYLYGDVGQVRYRTPFVPGGLWQSRVTISSFTTSGTTSGTGPDFSEDTLLCKIIKDRTQLAYDELIVRGNAGHKPELGCTFYTAIKE